VRLNLFVCVSFSIGGSAFPRTHLPPGKLSPPGIFQANPNPNPNPNPNGGEAVRGSCPAEVVLCLSLQIPRREVVRGVWGSCQGGPGRPTLSPPKFIRIRVRPELSGDNFPTGGGMTPRGEQCRQHAHENRRANSVSVDAVHPTGPHRTGTRAPTTKGE